jgi:MazG family protein
MDRSGPGDGKDGRRPADELGSAFEQLVAVVRRLRAPGGCPWDRAQTHDSLCRYVLEEARELVAAVGGGSSADLREELGDLLLQVVLHAVIAEEAGTFGPADVVRDLGAKLVRRHPHVFGGADPAASAEEAERRWAEVKAGEAAAGARGRWLATVPRHLTALMEAQALGERAAEVGFDWPDPHGAWAKVGEECAELGRALEAWASAGRPEGDLRAEVEAELGDALFALVNVARLCGLDAETALARANERFRARFAAVEDAFAGSPEAMRAADPQALDRAWQAAKRLAQPAGGGDSGPDCS